MIYFVINIANLDLFIWWSCWKLLSEHIQIGFSARSQNPQFESDKNSIFISNSCSRLIVKPRLNQIWIAVPMRQIENKNSNNNDNADNNDKKKLHHYESGKAEKQYCQCKSIGWSLF